MKKTNGRTEEFDNNVYKRFTILDTRRYCKTLTGTVFYNFASDSLDTKIDAQLNYANYQNSSDRLTSNTYFNATTNEMYRDNETVSIKTQPILTFLQK
jgi:hypothetical protein